MKHSRLMAMGAVLFSALALSAENVAGFKEFKVANPEMYAPAEYPIVHGRDFWVYLCACDLTMGKSKSPIAKLPVFSDSAMLYTAADKEIKDNKTLPRLTDEFGRTAHHLEAIESGHKAGKPFVICISNRRNRKVLREPLPELDVEHYRKWKAEHPDFLVFRSTAEIVNDVGTLVRTAPEGNRWAKYKNGDRYVMTAAVEDYYRTEVALHFGDESACIGFRGCNYSADFVTASLGARAIVGETTGTAGMKSGEWRWNISPMFLRGAGRQFNIPWMWYVALFVNGRRADGTWQNESWPSRFAPVKAHHREPGGISASLFRRVTYYTYLTGANAYEPEGWNVWCRRRKSDGTFELNAYGEAMSEVYDFTIANRERGLPYCPVAILVPYNQGYSSLGGVPYNSYSKHYRAPDHLVDAVFHTLMPGRDQDAAFMKGNEGFLRNSPFAQMYDVIVPDSTQDEESFMKVLVRYPVAVLTGQYRDSDKDSLRRKFARYLAAGGTLIVPKAHAGLMPEDSGKGKVVISASEWMTPPFSKDSLFDTRLGKLQFPELKALFRSLEDQLFPVKVSGDVLYGMNRAKTHDWVWCLNNRGVTKFTDTEEKVDPSAAETVTVDLRGRKVSSVVELLSGKNVPVEDGKFTYLIPAGSLAVFQF